jgi:hypothetical protein
MMMAQLRRDNKKAYDEKMREDKEEEILADSYKYYCPFDCEITQWDREQHDQTHKDGRKRNWFSVCSKCKVQGSMKPMSCKKCKQKLHVYRDHDYNCAKCAVSLGPKDVIGVKVMKCIFCTKNKINTFYEYGKGVMACQGCFHYRTRPGPFGLDSE